MDYIMWQAVLDMMSRKDQLAEELVEEDDLFEDE
jgi:hypothetical protein